MIYYLDLKDQLTQYTRIATYGENHENVPLCSVYVHHHVDV